MSHRGLVSQLNSRGIVVSAFASGVHKNNYEQLGPNNALYDDEKLFHSTVAQNQWLLIDFGKIILIDSYSIKSPFTTRCLSNWDLEVSNDNSSFYTIDSKRNQVPQTETKYAMYTPNIRAKTRYIRLYNKGLAYNYSQYQIYITFINFYGDPLFPCFTPKGRQFGNSYILLVQVF